MRTNSLPVEVASRVTDSVSNGISDPIAALRDDITSIRRDLAALARRGVEQASDQASAVMHKAADAARYTARRARDKAEHAHEAVSDFAHDRPVTTILLAATAGALLSMLLVNRCTRR